MKRLLLIVLGVLSLSFSVHAASFDCAKATTKVEKLICADTALSKLDEELAVAYKTALQDEKQADSIRQTQKRWMKDRNGCADAACVKRVYETRLHELTAPADTQASLLAKKTASNAAPLDTTKTKSLSIPDKPGLFKLDQSTNDRVCVPLGRIINEDIQKYGNIKYEKQSEFVKWRKVAEEKINRGEPQRYGESVERADVDINNDGVIDQVIRTKWSMRGVLDDELGVLSLNEQKIVIDELLKSEKKVTFTSGNYWMNRRIAKYGEGNYDWAFEDVASINLFQQNDVTYVVAHDYASPRNYSSHIYVFKYDKYYQPIDVCMFIRICPCGGCDDMRGNQTEKTLPAKKWCN